MCIGSIYCCSAKKRCCLLLFFVLRGRDVALTHFLLSNHQTEMNIWAELIEQREGNRDHLEKRHCCFGPVC